MKTHKETTKMAVLMTGLLLYATHDAQASEQATEYADFGKMPKSYTYEYTDATGQWSGTWELENYGNPAWWKKDANGNQLDSKSISECDTKWKVTENGTTICNFATVGALQFTLEFALEQEEGNAYCTYLTVSYSEKKEDYWDNYSVYHIAME